MMHTAPSLAISTPEIFGAPGTSVGSSNGQSYGSSVGGARPGKREADGGWSLSWCKDRTWGQVLAVAAGTTGVVKVIVITCTSSFVLICFRFCTFQNHDRTRRHSHFLTIRPTCQNLLWLRQSQRWRGRRLVADGTISLLLAEGMARSRYGKLHRLREETCLMENG